MSAAGDLDKLEAHELGRALEMKGWVKIREIELPKGRALTRAEVLSLLSDDAYEAYERALEHDEASDEMDDDEDED